MCSINQFDKTRPRWKEQYPHGNSKVNCSSRPSECHPSCFAINLHAQSLLWEKMPLLKRTSESRGTSNTMRQRKAKKTREMKIRGFLFKWRRISRQTTRRNVLKRILIQDIQCWIFKTLGEGRKPLHLVFWNGPLPRPVPKDFSCFGQIASQSRPQRKKRKPWSEPWS